MGLAFARRFLAAGAGLALADLSEERLASAADGLQGLSYTSFNSWQLLKRTVYWKCALTRVVISTMLVSPRR